MLTFNVVLGYQGLLFRDNLVPSAFPLKNGWGGKRPWHRLVTCPLVQQKYSRRNTLQQSISHLVIFTELEKLQIDLPLHAAEVSHPLPKLSPVTPEPVSTAFRFALKQRSRLFEQVICFVLFCSHPSS